MRFYHMDSEMSSKRDNDGPKRKVPALVVIIAGILGLNLIGSFSPDLAMTLAISTVAVALVLFVTGTIRRK